MKFIQWVFLALFVGAVWSCQDEKKPDSTTTSPSAASSKPELYLYRVDVNDLQVREQPSLQANVVGKLAEGALVEFKGEKSTNKEKVELRGIQYEEPFYKISAKSPAPIEGWAYSAALRIIYSGPRDQSPDLNTLSDFSAYIKTLKVEDVASGKKAWDYVGAKLSSVSGSTGDAVYSILNDFFNHMIFNGALYEPLDKISWTDDDYTQILNNTFNMAKYPATATLAANGFSLDEGEGQVFPVADWQKMSSFFMSRTTPTMQEYLKLKAIEEKDPSADDGGLVITMEQLIDRAAAWEQFVTAHPGFFLSDEISQSRDYYLISVINGMDNTPVYEWETAVINEEAKKAWAYAIQKYPNTKVGKSCKEISDLAAAAGWKRDEKVENYQMQLAKSVFGE